MSNFTSYAAFKTGVSAWLDITATDISSQIDDLISIGENRLFIETRTRDMETALSAVMTAGMIALPTNYVALKNAYIDGSPTHSLERRPVEWIYANYSVRSATSTTSGVQSGIPKYIARERTNFIFGPFPDSAYTVKGTYYVRLSPISTALNALFTANPALYLFACLAESEPLIGRDERIPIWEAKYQKFLSLVNGEDATEGASGSPIQMRVG